MIEFNSYIGTDDALIRVTDYSAATQYTQTGAGFGDCDPGEDEIFEYEVLRLDGTPWPERDTQVSEAADLRIYREFLEVLRSQADEY